MRKVDKPTWPLQDSNMKIENPWPFQEPINWRYLPYIRPIPIDEILPFTHNLSIQTSMMISLSLPIGLPPRNGDGVQLAAVQLANPKASKTAGHWFWVKDFVFTEKVDWNVHKHETCRFRIQRTSHFQIIFTPVWYSLGAQLNCPCILISVTVYSCIFPNCSKHLPVWGRLTWLHIAVGCKDVSKPRYRFEHPRPLNLWTECCHTTNSARATELPLLHSSLRILDRMDKKQGSRWLAPTLGARLSLF